MVAISLVRNRRNEIDADEKIQSNLVREIELAIYDELRAICTERIRSYEFVMKYDCFHSHFIESLPYVFGSNLVPHNNALMVCRFKVA